jgi:hypothetical protein
LTLLLVELNRTSSDSILCKSPIEGDSNNDEDDGDGVKELSEGGSNSSGCSMDVIAISLLAVAGSNVEGGTLGNRGTCKSSKGMTYTKVC